MSKNNNLLQRPASSVNLSSRLATPTPEIPISLQEKRVANLPISKNLDTLEATLSSLLLSISKYNPSIADAEKLVKTNQELESSIQDIITHQQSGLEIDSLEETSTKLDNATKEILLGLNECRRELRSLPSVSKALKEQKDMENNRIKTDELLQYAMKLAKFTTAPPTFDSGSIGPNNFIWPAEDSLRRGMLALASLKSEQLLGESGVEDTEASKDAADVEKPGNSSPSFQRRGSFGGSYGDGANGGADDVIEDLDLFDPDDL